jgi:hypothetical protein
MRSHISAQRRPNFPLAKPRQTSTAVSREPLDSIQNSPRRTISGDVSQISNHVFPAFSLLAAVLPWRCSSCKLVCTVRRFTAVWLSLFFVGVPVLSALAATSVSPDLPACCRKGGAHMCSVRRTQASQKNGESRLGAVCPFASHTKTAVTNQRARLSVSTNSSAVTALQTRRIVRSQVFIPAGNPLSGNPKRGPPLSLL